MSLILCFKNSVQSYHFVIIVLVFLKFAIVSFVHLFISLFLLHLFLHPFARAPGRMDYLPHLAGGRQRPPLAGVARPSHLAQSRIQLAVRGTWCDQVRCELGFAEIADFHQNTVGEVLKLFVKLCFSRSKCLAKWRFCATRSIPPAYLPTHISTLV
jgi:hypothetical protein